MKKLFTSLVLSLVSIVSMAENEQISTTRIITEVHTYATGATVVFSPESDGSGCSGVGAKTNVHIDWSGDENMKAMYSLALMAYASKKTVGFGVDGCASGNGGQIPKMYRMDVKD